jgi:hypothetical protein
VKSAILHKSPVSIPSGFLKTRPFLLVKNEDKHGRKKHQKNGIDTPNIRFFVVKKGYEDV